jgi:hypothetical protein
MTSNKAMRATGGGTRASLPPTPHAVALLRVCQDRPSNHCAADRSDEFTPSKANAHLHLPSPRRLGTSAQARLPRTGSRLQGEGLRPNRNRIIMGVAHQACSFMPIG